MASINDDVPTPPREILTERLLLLPAQESDAEAVFGAIDESRTELEAWMAWTPQVRAPEDLRRRAPQVRENWDARTDFGISIFRREDGRFLGGTGMHDPNWDVPSLSIGYWMRTSETGKGYVREAVTALTRVGFGQLGLRRMVITCAATNTRSRRVAESVGYHLEGRLRNDERLPNGDLRDTLVYSLIDSDDVVRELLAGESGTLTQ
ncbi:MAG: GNAT family N-acetyltransferase [Thermomicrobiales bacterium]